MSNKKVKTIQSKKVDNYQDYQDVFGNPKGQQVLEDLMRRFGFQHTTMATDPYLTAFNEGQRAVILEIIKILKLNLPELRRNLTAPVSNDF